MNPELTITRGRVEAFDPGYCQELWISDKEGRYHHFVTNGDPYPPVLLGSPVTVVSVGNALVAIRNHQTDVQSNHYEPMLPAPAPEGGTGCAMVLLSVVAIAFCLGGIPFGAVGIGLGFLAGSLTFGLAAGILRSNDRYNLEITTRKHQLEHEIDRSMRLK
jgi:hypothetical protein